jgi:hypothetical protein
MSLGAKLAIVWGSLVGLAVLAAAALLIAVPGAVLPLSSRKLPGFEISLPGRAADQGPGASNYRAGQVTARASLGRVRAQVTWEPGGEIDEADLDRMLRALATAIEASPSDVRRDVVVPIAGLRTQSWRIAPGGKLEMWGTTVACGARRMTITTGGRGGAIEKLHRRVAATFHCHPDRAREETLGDVPVVMDLPAGWSQVPGGPHQVEMTDGHFLLTARTLTGKLPDEDVIKVLNAAFAGQLRLGTKQGSDWPAEGNFGGKSLRGWLSLRVCPDLEQSLMLLALASDPGQTGAARKLLSHVRCRRAGEPPQTRPLLKAP